MKVKAVIAAGLQNPEFDEMLQKRFFKKTFLYGKDADRKSAQLEVLAANLFSTLGISQKTPKDLRLPSDKDFATWWPPADYKPSQVD
jgi:hypothetical protein